MANEPEKKSPEQKPAAAAAAAATSASASAPATPAATAAGPAPMILIAAVVGALIAGSAAGTFVVAPRFAPKTAATPAANEPEKEKKPGGHGKAKEGEKGAVHKIENLIVNPAGSEGQRFLMTTVAIEVPEKADEMLRDHDAEVRDVVIAALESETLITLTRPGARVQLKAKIADAVRPIVGKTEYLRVYLPQFVIQ